MATASYPVIKIMLQNPLSPPGHRNNRDSVAISTLLTLVLAGMCVDALTNPVSAMVFNIRNSATPEISIQVGGGGKAMTRVTFDVPVDEVGSGNPVAGNRSIRIRLIIRAPAPVPLTGFLTVDSATPLDNGRGATIPLSEISWTARYGDIPSGSYAGTSSQLLVSFTGSIRVDDRHTFQYSNTNIYDAGAYNGQVTYTWSAP
ncbi:MAG: hypothetical protein PVI28_11720 [Gammaproteobacteria bacterium]